jgi:Putative zinc-finger
MSVCIERAFIGRHFAGTLSPSDERVMREHLPTCEPCRALYERHLLLARLDPEALPAQERIARGLGLSTARRRWPTLAAATAIAATAAAAVVLLVARGARDDGFTSRGGAPAPSAPESRVFLYDVESRPRLLLAGDVVGRSDELALAYENRLAKKRLMVFGVDEHRHVYWFYPAWENEAEDPVAVPIAADTGRHELPEAVRHAFDGRTLEVHAVFVDSPFSVRQVEALVAARTPGPLPLPGSVESTTSLQIAP